MAVFKVVVFTTDRGATRNPLVTAYTRWFNPSWEGCCLHHVEAATGAEAKRKAIGEHKTRCVVPAVERPARAEE
jgi:hypothetical protein